MTTRVVDLVDTEYRLITDKTTFMAKLLEGNAAIRAQAALPEPNDEGLPLDPSKGLPRMFDGNVYGKAVGAAAKARVIILESDA